MKKKNRIKKNRKKKNRPGGFTLVEVLVAVTIFGIVVSMLFASFNIVISNVDPINAGLDEYEMAQNAMDRIKRDLNSLCLTYDSVYSRPDMEGNDEPDRFRFIAHIVSLDTRSFSQLRFASFEHLGFNRDKKSRIGIITYYTEPSEEGSILLKRSDVAAVFYDGTKENNDENDPVLCERVTSFELSFLDQEGNPHENWDSDSSDFDFATPYSIQIKLEIGDGQRSNIFVTTLVLPTQRDKDES
jgi:general secretion pathway protein J